MREDEQARCFSKEISDKECLCHIESAEEQELAFVFNSLEIIVDLIMNFSGVLGMTNGL